MYYLIFYLPYFVAKPSTPPSSKPTFKPTFKPLQCYVGQGLDIQLMDALPGEVALDVIIDNY